MILPKGQTPSLDQGESAPVPSAVPSSSNQLVTLRKRADFLACARAKRVHAPGMIVQGRQRHDDALQGPRVGFTCSKKVGNAVKRNHAKRRLHEAAREVVPHAGRNGWDYVLIGRQDVTTSRRFADLVNDLEAALGKLHGSRE